MENIFDGSQSGFRHGMGTTNATYFVMKMMLEKCWEWGISKYALFIDFEKAFVRIDRRNLWQILQDSYYNIPIKMVRVIRNMDEHSTSKIITQGIVSCFFEIGSGVRQGDVLSPLLFIIFMNKCLRDIQARASGEEKVMYADDLALIADSAADVQQVANIWYFGMKSKGMKVNTRKSKTEFVVISRTVEEYGIYMDQNKITQSEN